MHCVLHVQELMPTDPLAGRSFYNPPRWWNNPVAVHKLSFNAKVITGGYKKCNYYLIVMVFLREALRAGAFAEEALFTILLRSASFNISVIISVNDTPEAFSIAPIEV
jgi:hypothetical protein